MAAAKISSRITPKSRARASRPSRKTSASSSTRRMARRASRPSRFARSPDAHHAASFALERRPAGCRFHFMKTIDTTPLSILDLVTYPQGGSIAEALAASRTLAQRAETLGYRRYWLAEHHNLDGIAASATVVLMAYIAAHTTSIRVGSGGIMLPNHAPLVVAEQIGTLESLYPGRIDLGLGRAPGTDPLTMRALRRRADAGAEDFDFQVAELLSYLAPAP